MDAEYYQPEYLEIVQKLKTIPHKTLENISENLESFGAYALTSQIVWREEGIPFIVAENIKDGFIDLENVRCIDESVDEILKKSRVSNNQVLLSMSGSVGNAAVAYDISEKLNSNQDIVKITLKDNYSPFFISVFLNSKYGKKQVLRLPVGSIQQHIFLWQTKTLLIPDIEKNLQKEVETVYRQGLSELKNSKLLYNQAKNLLLGELGLSSFAKAMEDEERFSIANLSDVKSAGRMDAEYFHSKFRAVIDKVENFKGRLDYLEDLTTFINNGNQPPYSENGEIKFFSQKWIKDREIDYSFLKDEEIPKVAKSFFEDKRNEPYLVKKNDILYYSVGANLGFCHNYLESENIAIGSFINLIRADEKKINPIYLGFVLNSIIGRSQAEMNKSGLAQPYIYSKNLRKFKIPILPAATQQKIAKLVRESHEARKRTKELLGEAKRKVEEAIEKES